MDAEYAAPTPNQNSTPMPGSDLYRVITRLANILSIDEFVPKSPLLVHCPLNVLVRLDVDLVLTVQAAE